MVSRGFEWSGVRFRLPEDWDVAQVDNAVLAHDDANRSFTVTRRRGAMDSVVDAWDRELAEYEPRQLGVASGAGPVNGVMRELLVDSNRVLTQLFVEVEESTVVATYAADHGDSYDRDQAHRILRSIHVRQG